METSHPPFPFDRHRLVALFVLSASNGEKGDNVKTFYTFVRAVRSGS